MCCLRVEIHIVYVPWISLKFQIFSGLHAPGPPRWTRLMSRTTPPPLPMFTSCARHWKIHSFLSQLISFQLISKIFLMPLISPPDINILWAAVYSIYTNWPHEVNTDDQYSQFGLANANLQTNWTKFLPSGHKQSQQSFFHLC